MRYGYENCTVELAPVEDVLPQPPEHWIPGFFLVERFMGFLNVLVTSPGDLLIPGYKDSQGCDVLCLAVFSAAV